MKDEEIRIPRKREVMTTNVAMSFLAIFCLALLDFWEFNGTQRFSLSDLMSWGYIHLLVLGIMGLNFFLTLPDFLLIYSKEGIRWLSLRGYKLMRWSEINTAELNVTFWRGTRIILVSNEKRLVINTQLFANSGEAIAEIRKHVPEGNWK